MGTKVDKGFELIYWKLSYRRKFIRTLWTAPFGIIAALLVYFLESDLYLSTVLLILFLVLIFIQGLYNYIMWQRESKSESSI